MNLEKERELFWKWANDENPLLVEEAETGSQFHKDMLDHMFMGWVASASREGYKLVPVNADQKMIYAGESAEHKGCISVSVVYKAMIGACDD